jgi:ribosome-interacting GTPase 1
MLAEVPKHKGTEKLQQDIKTKLAKFRELLRKEAEKKKGGYSLAIKKEGVAQVILVGPPNTGKSLLLSKITNAKPDIANYDFTTTKPEVGIMDYETVKIQVVEIPAVVKDMSFKGKGPQFFSIVRNADLIIIVTDVMSDLKLFFDEFGKADIRLNEKKPGIRIKKMGTGGFEFVGQNLIKGDIKKVTKVLRDANIHNALVEVFEEAKLEDFKNAIKESLAYLPAFIVLTKGDLPGTEYAVEELKKKYSKFDVVPVSLIKDINIDMIKKMIWEKLNMIRIYTKEPGKKVKKDDPVCLKKHKRTVKDLALHVHKDFVKKFEFARVWGKSAKHHGQRIGLEHELEDEDIVELHIK